MSSPIHDRAQLMCPACGSGDVTAHGKRYGLYPAAIPAVVGLVLAIVHQLSSPWDYTCEACGADFSRRSTLGRIAGWLLVLILGFAALAFLLRFFLLAAGG